MAVTWRWFKKMISSLWDLTAPRKPGLHSLFVRGGLSAELRRGNTPAGTETGAGKSIGAAGEC